MKQIIYADNAATTQLDMGAFEAMVPYLLNEYGNASQPYSFSRKPKQALADARETIAKCINAKPNEIYFTSGGTESDNWAIKSTALFGLSNKSIVTSAIEHHAVINACKALERQGHLVYFVQPDDKGVILPEKLDHSLPFDAKLVSIMFSNNEIGTIEPIKDLVNISHKKNALFHTDAVQAVGHVHIDVQELGVDMLSASAHKFNGPKGVGFLYVREGVSLTPLLDGGAQERGHRASTENIASIVGMAAALKSNVDRIGMTTTYLLSLEKRLLSGIAELDFVRNGSENHVPGTISLSFRKADGEALLHRLDLKGIMISTGAACDSIHTNLSHVIKAIHVPDDYAKGTIRISFGKNNTEDEVDKIIAALLEIVKQ